jgi:hypothetical protein
MRELAESEEMPSDNPEILPHARRKMMLFRLGQYQLRSRQRDRRRSGELRRDDVQGAQRGSRNGPKTSLTPSVIGGPHATVLPRVRRRKGERSKRSNRIGRSGSLRELRA